MYLVYLKYWTLNLMHLMVYPKVRFIPNYSIKGPCHDILALLHGVTNLRNRTCVMKAERTIGCLSEHAVILGRAAVLPETGSRDHNAPFRVPLLSNILLEPLGPEQGQLSQERWTAIAEV